MQHGREYDFFGESKIYLPNPIIASTFVFQSRFLFDNIEFIQYSSTIWPTISLKQYSELQLSDIIMSATLSMDSNAMLEIKFHLIKNI